MPVVWQFLMLELAIDGLRLASLNTPSMLSTPLSVVAGIVLGQFTVDSGWLQRGNHDVYGLCSHRQLYPVQL